MPRSPSLAFGLVTALLNRVTTASGVAAYSTQKKSAVCKQLRTCQLADDGQLRRRASPAPDGAFLAVDFVLVPHVGAEMQGLNYHYSGQAQTRLGHQFTSAALVMQGHDPVPLLESFKVSRLLQTDTYVYRSATQEMIHVVARCRDAGVPFAGLLLDGEFGREETVAFSQEQHIPVLVRAKNNMTVTVGGEVVRLEHLAQRFPPGRCHLYEEMGWRVKRLSASRSASTFDVLVVWRKVHGEWTCFFLFSTFDSSHSVRTLLRAWKARWGIEVIHRLFKQNFGLGACQCQHIQAQENWAWGVIEAFHAVLAVRRVHPDITWRTAQRLAAQEAVEYVLTNFSDPEAQLDAA